MLKHRSKFIMLSRLKEAEDRLSKIDAVINKLYDFYYQVFDKALTTQELKTIADEVWEEYLIIESFIYQDTISMFHIFSDEYIYDSEQRLNDIICELEFEDRERLNKQIINLKTKILKLQDDQK